MSLASNRLFAQALTLSGKTSLKKLLTLSENLTSTLAILEEPNISSPSLWRERSTDVLMTLRAFLDVAREMTMTMPARIKNMTGVLAGESSDAIMKEEGSAPGCAMKS